MFQPPLAAADSVEDIEDPHHLSLEEEKRHRIEEQRRKKVPDLIDISGLICFTQTENHAFKVVKDKLFIQRRLASLRNTFRSLVKR